ncbi:MAG: DUF2141 domain-containing protein [Bacteroidales bacterium]|jgi:uncharacterized protein (DUF2141 family)|nr:DUF2141 domain-containing protein [Bacteroidales bacterium]
MNKQLIYKLLFNSFYILLLGALFSFKFASFEKTKGEPVHSLCIEVDGLRNSQGNVQFALYNKSGSIPNEKFLNYYKIAKAKIINGSSSINFENLPDGTYAVNILHDENNNGKIDKGFLFPKEGVGFSNY